MSHQHQPEPPNSFGGPDADEHWLGQFASPTLDDAKLGWVKEAVRAEIGMLWLERTSVHPVLTPEAKQRAIQAVHRTLAGDAVKCGTGQPLTPTGVQGFQLATGESPWRPVVRSRHHWMPLAAAALVALFVGRGLLTPRVDSPHQVADLLRVPPSYAYVHRVMEADWDALATLEADVAELEAVLPFGGGVKTGPDAFEDLHDEIDDLTQELAG